MHGMAFTDFGCPGSDSSTFFQTQLCLGQQIVPKMGRVEQINDHWSQLRALLRRQGIEVMESLPQKRRTERASLRSYFTRRSDQQAIASTAILPTVLWRLQPCSID